MVCEQLATRLWSCRCSFRTCEYTSLSGEPDLIYRMVVGPVLETHSCDLQGRHACPETVDPPSASTQTRLAALYMARGANDTACSASHLIANGSAGINRPFSACFVWTCSTTHLLQLLPVCQRRMRYLAAKCNQPTVLVCCRF